MDPFLCLKWKPVYRLILKELKLESDLRFLTQTKRILQTVRYLKPEQIYYRLMYQLIPVRSLEKHHYEGSVNNNFSPPQLPSTKNVLLISNKGYTFNLLNIEKTYPANVINWTDQEHGRLWNYNLQYADFLNQDDLPVKIRERLLSDLYNWLLDGKLPPEPYPASLRIINAVRFCSEHHTELEHSQRLMKSLYSELKFLSGRLEYHLSGNHLLENGFALLMGGTFLKQEKWEIKAKNLLKSELEKQILEDGGHYERSPMYHQIILFRVLEAIGYLEPDSELSKFLRPKAEKMLSWLRAMTFNDGSFACFNDSSPGIAYTSDELIEMAENLSIQGKELPLSDSGYRVFNTESAKLIVDACGIKPDHQPGHAHADSLSFVLHIYGMPVIVDPAVSSYETGERRDWERSTQAHNTTTVQNQNSADVWQAFRVGRRPQMDILEERHNSITAKLSYKTNSGLDVQHKRSFEMNDDQLELSDHVICQEVATGRLYLDPNVNILSADTPHVKLSGGINIFFEGNTNIKQFDYKKSIGFNKITNAHGIEYNYNEHCKIKIAWRVA